MKYVFVLVAALLYLSSVVFAEVDEVKRAAIAARVEKRVMEDMKRGLVHPRDRMGSHSRDEWYDEVHHMLDGLTMTIVADKRTDKDEVEDMQEVLRALDEKAAAEVMWLDDFPYPDEFMTAITDISGATAHPVLLVDIEAIGGIKEVRAAARSGDLVLKWRAAKARNLQEDAEHRKRTEPDWESLVDDELDYDIFEERERVLKERGL